MPHWREKQVDEEHFMLRSVNSSFDLLLLFRKKTNFVFQLIDEETLHSAKRKKKLRIFGQKSLLSCQINAQFHGFPKGMFCTLLLSQNPPPEMWWALFPHGAGTACCLAAFLNAATHTAQCQVISINRTRPVIYSNDHIQVPSGIVSCRSKCYVLFSLPFKHFISK